MRIAYIGDALDPPASLPLAPPPVAPPAGLLRRSDLLLLSRRNDSLSDFLNDLRRDIVLSPIPVRSAHVKKVANYAYIVLSAIPARCADVKKVANKLSSPINCALSKGTKLT